MKKTLFPILLTLFSGLALAQPQTSVTNGKDLAVRALSCSVTASVAGVSYPFTLPPSTLAHVAKNTGTLSTAFSLSSLFPTLGVNTTVTATSTYTTHSGAIAWTISDPGAIGKTVSATINGTTYVITVTGVSGTLGVGIAPLHQPVYDPFDGVFRSVSLEPTDLLGTNYNDVMITGTTPISGFAAPISIELKPTLAGLGGLPPGQFVKTMSVTPTNGTFVSGGTATFGITLSQAAPSGGQAVTLAGGPFTFPTPVTVPAGLTSYSFTLTAPNVLASTPGFFTAAVNGYTNDLAFTVLPLLANMTVPSTVFIGGGVAVVRVNLNAAAPTGGYVVYMHCDDANYAISNTVTVPAGSTFVDVPINTVTPNTANTTSGVHNTYVSAYSHGTYSRVIIALH